jgi:3-oxoacyl-[acyl-carrier-protein] synthase-3
MIPRSTVMGEASCAILIENTEKNHHLIATAFDIQGQYASGSWLNSYLQMDFEKKYAQWLSGVIKRAVQNAKISLNQIKKIIPHNVNLISWKSTLKKLGASQQQIFLENIPVTGHCFGADNFINLNAVLGQDELQPGDYYLLVTVGLGAVFVASVFQY